LSSEPFGIIVIFEERRCFAECEEDFELSDVLRMVVRGFLIELLVRMDI
jgi:hypothetical protein